MGIIVSSFVGCGREYFKNVYGSKIKIFDATELEPSIEDEENFDALIEDFYKKVMDEVPKHDIVFITSRKKIRKIFDNFNIDYDLFYPSKERRGEFIENLVRKRVSPKHIRLVDLNFDKMVDEIDDEEAENCYKHKMQNAGEFIGNQGVIMQYVNSLQNQ